MCVYVRAHASEQRDWHCRGGCTRTCSILNMKFCSSLFVLLFCFPVLRFFTSWMMCEARVARSFLSLQRNICAVAVARGGGINQIHGRIEATGRANTR